MQAADQPQRVFSIQDLPKRPKEKPGNYGRDHSFITNYYKITFKEPGQMMYQFQVTFEPEIQRDSRKLIREAIQSVKDQLEQKIGYFIPRGTIIWSFKQPKEIQSFRCSFDDTITKEKRQLLMTLKKTAEFSLNKLHADSKEAQRVIQVLNSELKKNLQKIGMVEIGKNSKFYDKKHINDNEVENSRLKVWRGFTTSIQILNGGCYLLVDFSTRVLRNQSLLDSMDKMSADEKRQLIGSTILAAYGNYRTYRIEDIDYSKNPKSTFKKDGKEISFRDYFKNNYSIKITDMNQPLINTSIKKKVLKEGGVLEEIKEEIKLLPEMVYLTGMTDAQRGQRRLMQNVALYTKVDPDARMNRNQELLSNPAISNNQIFSISREHEIVPGTILTAPTVQLSDTKVYPNNGDMRIGSKILSPATISDWLVIYTEKSRQDQDQWQQFYGNIIQSSKRYGIEIQKPGLCFSNGDLKSFLEKIDKDIEKNGKPKIVLTFLTNYESRFYSELKKHLYVKHGVPHQNVLRKSLNKNAMSVASNILLQMNVKLGEPLWRIVSSVKETKQLRIAIGGLAIYHKLIENKKSCAGFVGSVDDDFTRFFCEANLMEQNAQRVESLQGMMLNWLKTYFKRNKKLPQLMIMYRDGVGEGQIKGILEVELPALQKAIEEAKKKVKLENYNPQIIFLLANKKVPQRMFSDNRDNQRRGSKGFTGIMNPQSGSVIGQRLSRYPYDFFMVPQYVNQGSATPTHYVVVHNSSTLSEEALQTLTFEQCLNYYNWQGAIRIPASLMYANKLATMVGEHLKKTPKDQALASKLYHL